MEESFLNTALSIVLLGQTRFSLVKLLKDLKNGYLRERDRTNFELGETQRRYFKAIQERSSLVVRVRLLKVFWLRLMKRLLRGADGSSAVPSGTWKELVIAKSEEQQWSIGPDEATGTVNSVLVETLLQNEVFLVWNSWERFPNIQSELGVGGFQFRLSPFTNTQDPQDIIMVCKYFNQDVSY